jgi:hypothetical protein
VDWLAGDGRPSHHDTSGAKRGRGAAAFIHLWTALLAAVVVGSCARQPVPTSVLPATELFQFCRGIGLDAVLVGDPTDGRLAWLESRINGARMELVWPTGYVARFAPKLEVLDERGRIALREGDTVVDGCHEPPDAEGNPVVRIAP